MKKVQFNSNDKQIKIQGKIGLLSSSDQHNAFINLIKYSHNNNEEESVKLVFDKNNNNSIQIKYQQCQNVIKFPKMMRIIGNNKQIDININHIGNNFVPDMNFITRILNKPINKNNKNNQQQYQSKFTISSHQLQQQSISVYIKSIHQQIKIKQFLLSGLNCKFIKKPNKQHEQNYECDIKQTQKSGEYSGLLMHFNKISICQNGIQIQGQNDNDKIQETYENQHYLMLIIVSVIALLYTNQQVLFKLINRKKSKKIQKTIKQRYILINNIILQTHNLH